MIDPYRLIKNGIHNHKSLQNQSTHKNRTAQTSQTGHPPNIGEKKLWKQQYRQKRKINFRKREVNDDKSNPKPKRSQIKTQRQL